MEAFGPEDQIEELQEAFDKLTLLEKKENHFIGEFCADIWIWNPTHEFFGDFLVEACEQEAKGNRFAYCFYYGEVDNLVVFFAPSHNDLLNRFNSIAVEMS